MQALRSHEQIRDVNTRYHDVAAATYDTKWGIDFGEIGAAQVLGKAHKLLGADLAGGFDDALEVGAGTGYFSLNLMCSGVIRSSLTCTDISAGMLAALTENAQRLGLKEQVTTVQTDAEELPFPDASFDLVLGHAILHHIPDLDRAFAEFERVLRPGGRLLFAGEPSYVGDRIAQAPKQAARALAPLWRGLLRASAAPDPDADGDGDGDGEHDDHALEREVDIHAFRPADLTSLARAAGFEDIQVRGEELVANWFGWFNRALEASADPDDVPIWWRRYAFHGYLRLQRLDARALEPHLPPALFYNLLLAARKR